MKLRIGSGIDFHQLVIGRDLWIGGIKIPHTKGALGHSDADVLLHAICDALLGALSLGDIGTHFNIDATLCLESPKLTPYVLAMQECIAGILHIGNKDISIKATTTETMGFTGREEGLVAMATCLLSSANS